MDEVQYLRDAIAERDAANEKLRELLRGVGANRYWEGRWRDEHTENQKLRAALEEITKAYVGNYHDLGRKALMIARKALTKEEGK